MSEKVKEKSDKQLYMFSFHESRFPIVEEALSPENAQKFRALSNEDKALFINVLIAEGRLSW